MIETITTSAYLAAFQVGSAHVDFDGVSTFVLDRRLITEKGL